MLSYSMGLVDGVDMARSDSRYSTEAFLDGMEAAMAEKASGSSAVDAL